MKFTFEYILYCQSPALFLAALLLLICYLIRKRNQHVRAVLDLIVCILCVAAGIALYYLAMLHEVFTIKDFWQIRVPGWVGLIIVAAISVFLMCRAFKRVSDKRQAQKNANRAENARRQEMEEIRQQAYASGMADAMAAETPKPIAPETPIAEAATAEMATEAAKPITLTTDAPDDL
ncbi:MAG: hypothetical protein KBS74_00100 [Clostridiales bacterium]|nr:hypothetical protein [Candidatus Cacconaster stercorequi]